MATKDVPAGYVLQGGAYPSAEDYVLLRTASSLSAKSIEQASAAIKGSWYGCYVAEEFSPRKAVAMGRVIGDGSWYFIIADMAVLPEHQRRGLGDAILKKLLAQIKSHAVKGSAFVTLSADEPGRKLYLRNGFKDSMPKEMGMGLVLPDCGQ
ncbi:putative GNAT family acetyltransferase [Xylariales sp. AK1849]|nr:putative GNAT family acetyltransferase [Xylariales sp. AK1849]